MYEAGLSQDFRTQILKYSEKINLNFCKIKENVQNIDKIKNELSENLTEIYEHFSNIFDWWLKNYEFENLFKFYSVFENDRRFSIEELLGIDLENEEKQNQDNIFEDDNILFMN